MRCISFLTRTITACRISPRRTLLARVVPEPSEPAALCFWTTTTIRSPAADQHYFSLSLSIEACPMFLRLLSPGRGICGLFDETGRGSTNRLLRRASFSGRWRTRRLRRRSCRYKLIMTKLGIRICENGSMGCGGVVPLVESWLLWRKLMSGKLIVFQFVLWRKGFSGPTKYKRLNKWRLATFEYIMGIYLHWTWCNLWDSVFISGYIYLVKLLHCFVFGW